MPTHTALTRTYRSPNRLSAEARDAIVEMLLLRLADGLDLHSQIKVAHWNVKGPHFATLHPLFETFAIALAAHNDTIAERAVTLGGVAIGTVRQTAMTSAIPEYPADVRGGLEHVRLLCERFEAYLVGLRKARHLAERFEDTDTVDLLGIVITEFEKYTWFLLASLEE